ncbi:DUF4386 domain-containing protein [Kocuria sp. M1R5S2]|uniref:DUF4386 domain-containing protein n=1 Tax=Kocuria rhizosphaerae TaxID=3376285 RepID=UPI00378AD296
MISARRTAVATGVLFLISHITSVPALLLRDPVLNDPNFLLGTGPVTPILLAALLDVLLALSVVGTAVAIYPVVRRQNEGVALGYVGLRTLEAAVIAAGVVALLAVVTLRTGLTGISGAEATKLGSALVALHNATFLLGPGLVLGTNTVLLAWLLYRSGLVPRFIPVLGLIGRPMVFVVAATQLFGAIEQYSSWATMTAMPAFAFELALAFYLIIKGFRPSALARLDTAPAGPQPATAQP